MTGKHEKQDKIVERELELRESRNSKTVKSTEIGK
jgi:hypothetical protein